jgi:hypothetical protein
MAFWVSGLAGSLEDRISVISRSARKLVKKLIQPFGKGTPARLPRAKASSTPIYRESVLNAPDPTSPHPPGRARAAGQECREIMP